MAALSTADEVRSLGNLPAAAQMPDAVITPHLASAARELTSWIGDYSTATGDKLADCKEAEQCICMAYLTQVLNTFFTHGAATLQKEIGEMDFMFDDPEDAQRKQDQWMERARKRVNVYAEQTQGKGAMSWHVI